MNRYADRRYPLTELRPANRYDVDDVISYVRPRPMSRRDKALIARDAVVAFVVFLGLIAAASVDFA